MILLSSVLKGKNIVIASLSVEAKTAAGEGESISGSVSTGDLMTAHYEKMIWRARLDANKIVSEAETFTKNMVERAAEKMELERAEVKKAGFLEGYQCGHSQAMEEVRTQLEELSLLMQQIEKEKEEILLKHEAGLKEFGLTVAEKIIDTELQAGDSAFLALYRQAVQDLQAKDWVKVTVSDAEAKFATTHRQMLQRMVRGAQTIKVDVLPGAPRGTCVVETSQSIVDAGVETQLSCLREVLDNVDLQEKDAQSKM